VTPFFEVSPFLDQVSKNLVLRDMVCHVFVRRDPKPYRFASLTDQEHVSPHVRHVGVLVPDISYQTSPRPTAPRGRHIVLVVGKSDRLLGGGG
jgi:predicted glycosyltransferase